MDVLKSLNYVPGLNDSGSLISSLSSYAPAESFGQSLIPANGMPDAVSGGGGLLDSISKWWSGGKDSSGIVTNGAGSSILGIAQGLGNAYMGLQQFGLAKKALAQSKEQFNKNYEAQKRTTNASLEDRQRARLAANPNGYESVGTYMNKNAII